MFLFIYLLFDSVSQLASLYFFSQTDVRLHSFVYRTKLY